MSTHDPLVRAGSVHDRAEANEADAPFDAAASDY
jgi:hypothetical protein